MRDAPIGTIVAFGGNYFTPEDESNTGWLLCDGRAMDPNDPDNAALFRAIAFSWGRDASNNFFHLPDLRGYFLRGVDVRGPADSKDKDGETRHAIREGGATGKAVGSAQHYATALPSHPDTFQAELDGTHNHPMNFQLYAHRDVNGQDNTVAFPGDPSVLPPTEFGGTHTHAVIGGNKETRPLNAGVNWIIRAQ